MKNINLKILLNKLALSLPVLRNQMHFLSFLMGMVTYIPGLSKFLAEGTGGTNSARYCYSAWIRHLTMAYKNGLSIQPNTIAELGPGDSLGIGLAALISGTNKYYALDVIEHTSNKKNIEIFDELVNFFKNQEKIIDESEFPNYIFTDERLNEALSQDRIDSIRNTLSKLGHGDENNKQIFYFVPWTDTKIIKEASVNMAYSHAVLEHVDDLATTYKALYRWLEPGGFTSHLIDFSCHGTAKKWNGHWAYSDRVWNLVKGKRPYLLNRQPHSVHINLLKKIGFEIICDIKTKDTSGIDRKSLSSRFKNMSDDDLITRETFIQAVKKFV